MPEDSPAGEHISQDDRAELATLFERFEFAFDPLGRIARESESEFTDRVQRLYEERVKTLFPEVSPVAFACHLKTLCRSYIRKNLPTDPTDRPRTEI